jgi:pimeloyl-ACP methyl ester carboxylesterase
MNLSFVRDTSDVALRTARGVLCFGERVMPWPLSWIPRAARVPLDVIEALTGLPAAPEHPAASSAPAPADVVAPHATAAIAGARRADHQASERDDREFRARLAPLYTRAAGDGPALVLLHAFPLGSRMWEPQLRSLADRFRVIAPDLAGFGLSWTPEGTLSLRDQARAVELTLDHLGTGEMILVGLSLGGYVAFPLLERLRARVRGLVLASTRATADAPGTVDDRHRLAAEVEEEGVEVAASELLPRLLGETATADDPALVDHVHALILENRAPGIAAALRAMASRPDHTRLLGRMQCPVLVIAGDEDRAVPLAEARAMTAKIPSARLAVLHAGHLVNLEAPAGFDRAVAEFARDVGASDAHARPPRAHGAQR